MRSILPGLTACLLLFATIGAASQLQDEELDSLAAALEQHVEKDTAYLETLITLARKIRLRDFSRSESYFTEAISLSEQLADKRRLARSFNGAGITYGMQDKYSAAISCFNQGLELALRYEFMNTAAISYASLGIVYKRMGEYSRSLECYIKSLRIYESRHDAEGVASTNHNLGVLFDMMDDQKKALEYFRRALAWYEENNYGKNIASLRSSIANVQLKKEEYDLAAKNYKSALDYYLQHDIRYSIVNTRANMGWMYYKTGELDRAVPILQKSLAGANSYHLPQQKVAILYSLSRVRADQGFYPESLRLALEAKRTADSIRSLRKQLDAQHLLSYVYEKAGNTAKALEHYKYYAELQDSLFNDDKVRSYKSQQVMMEVDQKEKELKAQALEMTFLNQQLAAGSRWKWMLGIACFFLLLTGSVYYQKYRQRRKYSDELESKNQLVTLQKAEIEEMNTRLEKRMLRAQMNPHFIFNALSAIQHFITANDKAASLHYLSLFSTMLRQVLETSVNTSMALKEEIEFLNVYLELEALRFEKSFVYEINVDGDLDVDMFEIPAMIIQPFVENAILHGLMPLDGPRKLTLDIVDGGKHISCSITDNGVGREEAARINQRKMSNRPSRGVFLAQQRLGLLKLDGDAKTGLTYVDLKDKTGKAIGTKVIIDIPKQELL